MLKQSGWSSSGNTTQVQLTLATYSALCTQTECDPKVDAAALLRDLVAAYWPFNRAFFELAGRCGQSAGSAPCT